MLIASLRSSGTGLLPGRVQARGTRPQSPVLAVASPLPGAARTLAARPGPGRDPTCRERSNPACACRLPVSRTVRHSAVYSLTQPDPPGRPENPGQPAASGHLGISDHGDQIAAVTLSIVEGNGVASRVTQHYEHDVIEPGFNFRCRQRGSCLVHSQARLLGGRCSASRFFAFRSMPCNRQTDTGHCTLPARKRDRPFCTASVYVIDHHP